MSAKWKQIEKEGFDPYIWIFINGDTFSVRDNFWIKKIKQNYNTSKIIRENQNETDQNRNKKQ